MEGSAWLTIQESFKIVRNNGIRLFGTAFVFGLLAIGIAIVLLILLAFTLGVSLMSLAALAEQGPSMLFAKASTTVGLLGVMFLWYVFGAYFIGVGMTWYLLHLVRYEPVNLGQAIERGLSLTIGAWRVVLGEFLLRLAPVGFLILALTTEAGAKTIFLAFAILGTLIFIAIETIFTRPLVVDGATHFFATIKQSMHFLKISWVRLFGLWFYMILISSAVALAMYPLTKLLGIYANFITGPIQLMLGVVYGISFVKVYEQLRLQASSQSHL